MPAANDNARDAKPVVPFVWDVYRAGARYVGRL
jgi:hypothetical protein